MGCLTISAFTDEQHSANDVLAVLQPLHWHTQLTTTSSSHCLLTPTVRHANNIQLPYLTDCRLYWWLQIQCSLYVFLCRTNLGKHLHIINKIPQSFNQSVHSTRLVHYWVVTYGCKHQKFACYQDCGLVDWAICPHWHAAGRARCHQKWWIQIYWSLPRNFLGHLKTISGTPQSYHKIWM